MSLFQAFDRKDVGHQLAGEDGAAGTDESDPGHRHSGTRPFPSGSKVYDNVAGGWPYILSGLKTLLETGSPLKPEKAAV